MTTIGDAFEACGDFTPETLASLGFRKQQASELAALPDEWLGVKERPLLAELDLDVWRSEAGWWLVGSANETLHRHESWLYLSEATARPWHAVGGHVAIHRTYEDLHKVLARACFDFKTPRFPQHRTNPWTPAVYWQSLSYKPNTFGAIDRILLKGAANPIDLHDLAFHYSDWQARNPDFAGLPKNLVLGSHGLSTAAQIAQGNRESFVFDMRNDDAFTDKT